ncbi:MAG: hypothetical protein ACLVG5_07705 [Clostridium sp.]
MKSFLREPSGNKDQAVALYRGSGDGRKRKNIPGYEQALLAAGEACMEAGDHGGAKVLYEEALRTQEEMGDLKAGFAARWKTIPDG